MGRYSNKTHAGSALRVKLLIAVAACATILVALIVLLVMNSSSNNDGDNAQKHIQNPVQGSVENQPSVNGDPEVQNNQNTTNPQEGTETLPTDGNTEPTQEHSGREDSEPSQPKNPEQQTPTPPTTGTTETVIALPYAIPGTNLVVQQVAAYEGIYLEDGSDSEVTNVAVILVYNAGNQPVEYAKITMQYEGATLQFELSALPAGERIVAQEVNKNSCATGKLRNCTADVVLRDSLEMSTGIISVVDNGDNTLTVTNLTDSDIVCVRVFYKFCMTEQDAYIGGITYTAKITGLEANGSVTISPSHFVSGASVVVMVRTYDSDA